MLLLQNKEIRNVLIAFLIGLIIAVALPPVNGLTPSGVLVIAILIPTLFLWITTNTHWVSLLFLMALVMTRVMSPNVVWQNSIGHFAVMTLLTYTLLTACLNETGMIDKAASWFITRPFVRGRPYMFLLMFNASNVFIGIFVNNLSLAVIYIGLTAVVCDKIGIKRGDPLYTIMVLGTLWGNCVLAIASPGNALPLMMLGFIQNQLGVSISFVQWFIVATPFLICQLAVIMICIRILNPDTTIIKNFDIDEYKRNDPPLSKRGTIAGITMVVVVMSIYIPQTLLMFGVWEGVTSYIANLGPVVPAGIGIAVLCLVHAEGKAVMDYQECAKQVPLPLLLFIGSSTVMSVVMSDPSIGVSTWLGNLLSPLVAGIPPIMIVFVLILIGHFISQFVSNAVTLVLIFNIGLALLAGTGVNLVMFGVVVTFMCVISCCTPSSAMAAAMYYSEGYITIRNAIKGNLLFIFLTMMVLFVVVVPFASFFFRNVAF